jgi:hypothetical protein
MVHVIHSGIQLAQKLCPFALFLLSQVFLRPFILCDA